MTRTSSPPWRKQPPRGEGQVKRDGLEEQSGQDAEDDPAREERRRIRRRRKLRLKAALLGRFRDGQTSKVHLAANRKCRPLAFVLTAGQAADSTQFMEHRRTRDQPELLAEIAHARSAAQDGEDQVVIAEADDAGRSEWVWKTYRLSELT